MRRRAAVALLSIAFLSIACAGSSRQAPTATPAVTPVAFATTRLRIDAPDAPRDIGVEVASAPAQTERGLGYRDALPAGAGMVFDLHETRVPSFWMKGMRFPLDMVWIGEDKRVAGVTANVPPQPGALDEQLRRYSPDAPVRYVLELNAGAAARLGIAAGTRLSFALP
jgi:hypothetical protein